MSDFDGTYYDYDYFASGQGKSYKRPDGRVEFWGYKNPDGFWDGCHPIAVAWKQIFSLEKCNTDTGLCKVCDIGCGRGQFVWALRNLGVEAWGFDFSRWAIENKYKNCQDGWIIQWDATKGWPYGDLSFDLTVVLDFFEHIYLEDLDFVISQMYRVSKKWIFLQIGTTPEKGYILKKGESIPVELEVNTVAGHVTVCKKEWWINKLLSGREDKWRLRDDMVADFVKRVDHAVIDNWIQNAIIVLERL
jgi:hypothetical protein